MTPVHPPNSRASHQPQGAAGRCLVAAAMLTLCGLSLPPATHATDEPAYSLEDIARTSDALLIGEVVAIEVFPGGPGGQPGIHSRVLIDVRMALGDVASAHVALWVQGGRLGDQMRVVVGQPSFEVDQLVAVFAIRDASGNFWPHGFGLSTWLVTSDGEETWAFPSPTNHRPTSPAHRASGRGGSHGAALRFDRFLERVSVAMGRADAR